MNFNKLCDLADFADAELASVIRDVCAYKLDLLPDLPRGAEHRKDWEVAMAVRALRHFGALRPDAVLLGVAAGTEDTLFYLTRHARQVFATDRYLGAGSWAPEAPVAMLVDPGLLAPYEFDRSRLVVQHMDARWLRYPDDTFDGIFSSGSIEHVGELLDVAHAAFEMGRVLKQGGVLTLATELQLEGPEGGVGWPGTTLLFPVEALMRYVVDASGLELVDDLQTAVSQQTSETRVGLSWAIADHEARIADPMGPGPDHEYACWRFPHVMVEHGDYLFASVHLALVKTDRYPLVPNDWARPSTEVKEAIAAYDRGLFTAGHAPAAGQAPATGPAPAAGPHQGTPASPPGTPARPAAYALDSSVAELVGQAELAGCVAEVVRQRELVEVQLDALGQWRERVRAAGTGRGAAAAPVPGGSRWRASRVSLADGTAFSVVVDPTVADPVSLALLHGTVLDDTLVRLMLDLVGPGDLVLDLGAHLGTFSLAAAAAGCRVLAVEAAPANARLLRASALRNGFAGLRVVQAAVGDAAGEVDFLAHGPWGQVAVPDEAAPHALAAEPPAGAARVTVPAVTVDALLEEWGGGRVSFVKLDVEGSELRALRGMSALLARADAPVLLYESNAHTLARHGTSPRELVAELEARGYASYAVEPGRLVRVGTADLQTRTITDHLALKGTPDLAGWAVETGFGFDEQVGRLLADGRHDNPHHRANIAATLARAGDRVLSQPAVAALLESLRNDPVGDVRVAAGWSSPR